MNGEPMNTHRRQHAMTPAVRVTAWVVVLAISATTLLRPTPVARGDKASDRLAKYRKPLDESIERALKYLSKHQEKDGSFKSSMERNTGISSLCVMAFLAKGYTPGTGPYGEQINRGIDFVLNSADKRGILVGKRESHGPMYSHYISTLLLSEVSGMVDPKRQKRIDKILPKALKVILSAQSVKKSRKHSGGWRYQHRSDDSDISCSGWALMALRSARGNGARVPEKAIDEGIEYILKCRHKDGGFNYQPGRKQPGLGRTGTALLCLELTGHHGEKVTRKAGDWIRKHLPRKFLGESHFYYAMYYASQGMFQLGGKYWEDWAVRMYEMMLKYQETRKGKKDFGSWSPGRGNEGKAGRCYATAMAVLAMTVSYRQLPIYQR
jgi:prenyltransferase beta subunit